ncbi:MAG TPA: hypothetical protein VNI84_09905 [Pyrinomonadaceae bacterium]|nr:hypothetical protein [Pyrinomonadaceae bacterium]
MKFRFLATLLLFAIIGNMSIMIPAQKNAADNTGETTSLLTLRDI